MEIETDKDTLVNNDTNIRHMRYIVSRLIKHELSEAFMYPVDSKLFPDYYKLISNPMYLTLIRDNIAKYPTVNEFVSDVRLIWSNCKDYNSEGAEVVEWANTLSDIFDELLMVI